MCSGTMCAPWMFPQSSQKKPTQTFPSESVKVVTRPLFSPSLCRNLLIKSPNMAEAY